jgi:drug/metabolite transporter (DMT)-like permease
LIYFKLFMTAVFWGGTFVAARVAARDVDPFSASFLRFFIASLFLVALFWKQEGGLPRFGRDRILPFLLLGMTGVFAYNIFFFLGMKTVDAGHASLIVANNPVLIALFSAFFFKEKLRPLNVAGICLSLVGVVVVITRGHFQGMATLASVGWGDLYILGCVASWVSYSLIGKAAMRNISPLAAVTGSCLTGTAALLIPALASGLPARFAAYPLAAWSALFFLGFFGTVLGFTWYYEGIKAIGASRASVFINFVPISGVVLGWLLLDETIGVSVVLGAVLVIGGVMLTNWKRTGAAPAKRPDEA